MDSTTDLSEKVKLATHSNYEIRIALNKASFDSAVKYRNLKRTLL